MLRSNVISRVNTVVGIIRVATTPAIPRPINHRNDHARLKRAKNQNNTRHRIRPSSNGIPTWVIISIKPRDSTSMPNQPISTIRKR